MSRRLSPDWQNIQSGQLKHHLFTARHSASLVDRHAAGTVQALQLKLTRTLCLTNSMYAFRCPASLLDAAARRSVTNGGGVAVLAGDRAAVHALATALTQLFPKVSQAARQGGAQQQPSERLLQAAAAFGSATLAFSGLEQRVAAAAAAAAPRRAPTSAAAAAGQRGCSGGAQLDVSGQLACVRLGAEVIGCVAGSSAQAAAMVASAQVGLGFRV